MHSKMELVLPPPETTPNNDWQDLINFLSGDHQYYPIDKLNQKKLYSGEPKHVIVTLNKVNTLLDELKQRELDELEERAYDENAPSYSEKYSLRYLVTPSMQILFAHEGQLSKTIPGHRHMADTCLAAGNIFFSKDYSRVTLISHDSGDFQPNANSLLWPVLILALCPVASCSAFNSENIVIKLAEYIETTLVHRSQETLSKALISQFTAIPDEIKKQIIAVNTNVEKIAHPIKTAEYTNEADFVYCTPPSSPRENRAPSGISDMLKNFINSVRAAMVNEMPVQEAADSPKPNQASTLQGVGLFATIKKRKSGTALYQEDLRSDDEETLSVAGGESSDDSSSSNSCVTSPLWGGIQPRFLAHP